MGKEGAIIMEPIIGRSNTPAMSDDIRALASAFLLAKQEFSATGKSGKNNQFGKYAKIEDIYHAVEDALTKNSIIIWHFARPDHRAGCDAQELLYTRLIHTPTGQFVEDCRVLESEKPGNQAKGSANTYMKKYAVLSLCAIPTEDDDGEAEEKYIEEKRSEEPFITQEQVNILSTELKACANAGTLFKNIQGYNDVKDLPELRASSFKKVREYIANNRK